jgi:hypothetical protein
MTTQSIDPLVIWQLRSRVFSLYETYGLDLVRCGSPTPEVAQTTIATIVDSLKDIVSEIERFDKREDLKVHSKLKIDELIACLPCFATEGHDVGKAWGYAILSLGRWAMTEEIVNEKYFTGQI